MMSSQGFSQGIGRWTGCAEVYDGSGCFLGHGHDRRTVGREAKSGKVRVEVTFTGPFQLHGHYDIDDRGSHRVYQGPANYGFAEALAPNLVDANGYWPDAGLSQRVFMIVLPGGAKQLSLALMSRGEQLLYCVVGENDRVPDSGDSAASPAGAATHPATVCEDALLHRAGCWQGHLSALGQDGEFPYKEEIESTAEGLRARFTGGFHAPDPVEMELRIDDGVASSGPGDLAGSYSLTGGRALAGTFHRMSRELRLWRREVVTRDGTRKAVVHLWFRGQERVGAEWGVLEFEPA